MQAQEAIRAELFVMKYKASTIKTYMSQVSLYLKFAQALPEVEMWSDESGAYWILHELRVRRLAKSTVQGKIAAFAFGVFKYTGRQVELGKDKRYTIMSMVSTVVSKQAGCAYNFCRKKIEACLFEKYHKS